MAFVRHIVPVVNAFSKLLGSCGYVIWNQCENRKKQKKHKSYLSSLMGKPLIIWAYIQNPSVNCSWRPWSQYLILHIHCFSKRIYVSWFVVSYLELFMDAGSVVHTHARTHSFKFILCQLKEFCMPQKNVFKLLKLACIMTIPDSIITIHRSKFTITHHRSSCNNTINFNLHPGSSWHIIFPNLWSLVDLQKIKLSFTWCSMYICF